MVHVGTIKTWIMTNRNPVIISIRQLCRLQPQVYDEIHTPHEFSFAVCSNGVVHISSPVLPSSTASIKPPFLNFFTYNAHISPILSLFSSYSHSFSIVYLSHSIAQCIRFHSGRLIVRGSGGLITGLGETALYPRFGERSENGNITAF